MNLKQPIIITMGDPAGVGPELILKLFSEKPHLGKDTVIFSDAIVLEKLIRKFHLSLKIKELPIIDLGIIKKFNDIFDPELAGLAAYRYLEEAIACMQKKS